MYFGKVLPESRNSFHTTKATKHCHITVIFIEYIIIIILFVIVIVLYFTVYLNITTIL